MSARDFYTFRLDDHREVTYPRVTSLIRIIDKSNALIGWATNVERAAFKLALEDVLTTPGPANDPQTVYDLMMAKMEGKRAHVKARDDAANIGHAAHDLIRWHTVKLLGQDNGRPEPVHHADDCRSRPPRSGACDCPVPDAALRVALAWIEWGRLVDFTPIDAELFLYCEHCAVAGTTDVIAKVNGLVTVVDYKSAPPPKSKKARRVYPESLIQTAWYRHMARMRGIDVAQTMVVRLPKMDGDTWGPEDAVVGPELPLRLLHGIATTWRTMKLLDNEFFGDSPTPHPEGVSA